MKCFETLGLDPEASEQEVKSRWHKLAALHHPDKGGNPTEFSRLHEAYRRCMDEVQTRVCKKCSGSGRVSHQHGWSMVHIACEACGGLGRPTTIRGG